MVLILLKFELITLYLKHRKVTMKELYYISSIVFAIIAIINLLFYIPKFSDFLLQKFPAGRRILAYAMIIAIILNGIIAINKIFLL